MGINLEAFEITDELMEQADTYIPYMYKSILIKDIAERCLKDVFIKKDKEIINVVKGEDLISKNVFLLSTLLGMYFHIDIPEEEYKENPYAVYDYYASKNPIGQLEKYRKNGKYADKAYLILNDYKELKRLVDTEIYNLRNAYNDMLYRLRDTSSELLEVLKENGDEEH